MSLTTEILNLQTTTDVGALGSEAGGGYLLGHADARKAAAELPGVLAYDDLLAACEAVLNIGPAALPLVRAAIAEARGERVKGEGE